MKLKKLFLIVIGCLSFGLGALGSILPVLPTFPFLLLAAFCFTRSSERLNAWFKTTKLYRDNLETYAKGEGMTIRTKTKILGMSTFFMAISFLAVWMKEFLMGQIIIAGIWIILVIYFIFGIKTKKE